MLGDIARECLVFPLCGTWPAGVCEPGSGSLVDLGMLVLDYLTWALGIKLWSSCLPSKPLLAEPSPRPAPQQPGNQGIWFGPSLVLPSVPDGLTYPRLIAGFSQYCHPSALKNIVAANASGAPSHLFLHGIYVELD